MTVPDHKTQDECTSVPLADLPPGEVKRVEVGGEPVCVANADGTVYAVSDTCTHANISLSAGSLAGRQIVCPWHQAMFDMKTGRPTCGPAIDPVRTYAARIEDGTIIIEAAAPEE